MPTNAGPRLEQMPDSLRDALSGGKIPGLGALRAICAALVVFYHLGVPRVPGGYGVLAFFVLSGFLITWLLLREEQAHGAVALGAFYARRSLRIFPAFYAFWLIATVAWWLMAQRGSKPVDWWLVLSSFTYTANYYQAYTDSASNVLSHTWSLAVEEQFYLFWPLLFRWLGPKRRLIGLVVLIALVTIHRIQLYFIWDSVHYAYEAFDARADHLLYGCLLAVAIWHGRGAAACRWLCRHPLQIAAVVALIITSTQLSISLGSGYRNVIGFTLEPILTCVWIVQVMASRRWPSMRWWHHRWAETLGAWSYSTYLYQQLAVGASIRISVTWAPVIGAVLTYGAAWASYRFIERPFLRFKKRFVRVLAVATPKSAAQ